jgi:hypothetical protein
VPRAAFGLPIIVGFKDPGDKEAAGRIGPAGPPDKNGNLPDRFTSPVRLTVVACTDGRFVPVVMVVPVRWERVGVFLGRATTPADVVPVAAPDGEGAVDPIKRRLVAAKGDAILAWCRWLEQEKGFKSLLGSPVRKEMR